MVVPKNLAGRLRREGGLLAKTNTGTERTKLPATVAGGEFQGGMNQLYGIDNVFGVRYTQKKLSFAPTF